MTRISTSRARGRFAEIVNEVAYQGKRVVLQRHGKSVAAVVPVRDLELIEALEDRIDLAAARKALAVKGANVPWAKLRKELGL